MEAADISISNELWKIMLLRKEKPFYTARTALCSHCLYT